MRSTKFKKLKKLRRSKKAIAAYLAYVFLAAFFVVLSAVMYNWITATTQTTALDLRSYVDSSTECNYVSFDVNNVCQTHNELFMELENKDFISIKEVLVRLFDGKGEAMLSRERLDLISGTSTKLIIKKSHLNPKLEILPVISSQENNVICKEKTFIINEVPDCE